MYRYLSKKQKQEADDLKGLFWLVFWLAFWFGLGYGIYWIGGWWLMGFVVIVVLLVGILNK